MITGNLTQSGWQTVTDITDSVQLRWSRDCKGPSLRLRRATTKLQRLNASKLILFSVAIDTRVTSTFDASSGLLAKFSTNQDAVLLRTVGQLDDTDKLAKTDDAVEQRRSVNRQL